MGGEYMTGMDIYKSELKSSPFKYFYGNFIRTNNKDSDFKIYETNLNEDEVTNKTLNYVMNYYNLEKIDINKLKEKIDKTRSYESEYIKAVKLEDNNIIIWYKGIITNKDIMKDISKAYDINFKQIAENVNDVIIIRENEKFIYVNKAFENVFGRPCSDLYNISKLEEYKEYVHPEDRYKISKYKNEESFEECFRIIRGDNEVRWVWYKSNFIKYNAKDSIKKVIIISDITAKKNEEFELEKLKMDFFSNLSHEFKTPINLIFTSLQMLKLSLDKNNEEVINNYQRYIKIANQNIFRLTKLVDNLIDCTKINSGEIKYTPVNKDIVSFIENICESVVAFGKNNAIEVIFDTEIEEKIISFDLDKMERVMFNLLSNAIKSIKLNGKIEVNISLIEGNVAIKIKDNGVGFSKDKIQGMFSIFNHINSRMTKISEGSGVGLFLVKALIEMHNGRIDVESELGKGAQFTIILPDIIVDKIEEDTISKQIDNLAKQRAKVEFSDIYW